MLNILKRIFKYALATIGATCLVFSLAACSSASEEESSEPAATEVEVANADGTVTVVPVNPQNVVALDNTSLETLAEWGITPVAISKTLSKAIDGAQDWINDENVFDVGTHREPDFEGLSGIEVDLVIGGNRFSSYTEELAEATGAPVINIAATEDAEGGYTAALKYQIETLGKIFQKETEAAALIASYDEAAAAVAAAVSAKGGISAIGLVVNGGEIGVSDSVHIFDGTNIEKIDISGEEQTGSTHGDSISLEAIAETNPDWVVVIDRDAAVGTEGATPAKEVIESNEAFAKTTFITEGHVYILPDNFYTTNSIQAYTTVFNDLAGLI